MMEVGQTPETTVPAVSGPEMVTLWAYANAAAASKMYREAFTPREAYARILAGRDLGLSAADSLTHMNYLDGKFEPSGEITAALLKAYVGPDGERYDYRTTGDNEECIVVVLRRYPGESEWTEIGQEIYTIADAERMEITGSAWWQRSPRKMLFWRALTNAVDIHCPQVVHPRPASGSSATGPVDLSELPIAPSDPLAAVGGRVEDPRNATTGDRQHLRRHYEHLKVRGLEQRFVDALNAVAAAEDEDVVRRYNALDENQAAEVCLRLGKTPPPISEDEWKRLNPAQDGPLIDGQQGGHE